MIRMLLFAASISAALPAQAALTWNHAFRARLEQVDDDAFARDAWAPTARLRTGARIADAGQRMGAIFDVELVANLGDDFNSGANRATAYPAVTDPAGVEFNQAALFWRMPAWGVQVGRQRLQFDNQRFIGNSAWRQNEQTFDALAYDARAGETELRYVWLERVHRVAGDRARVRTAREHALAGHVLHAARATSWGSASGYAYLIENRTLPAAGTASVGVRWATTPGTRFGMTAEVAHQTDYRTHQPGFSHGYRLLELDTSSHGVTWRAGIEQLRGNGRHAFQTPLATLHAFNGWADMFTTTPPGGLEDRYLSASRPWAWAESTLTVAWHDFRPTIGGAPHHGREWDASISKPLGDGWNLLAKFATYQASGFATDTSKAWLQLEWNR